MKMVYTTNKMFKTDFQGKRSISKDYFEIKEINKRFNLKEEDITKIITIYEALSEEIFNDKIHKIITKETNGKENDVNFYSALWNTFETKTNSNILNNWYDIKETIKDTSKRGYEIFNALDSIFFSLKPFPFNIVPKKKVLKSWYNKESGPIIRREYNIWIRNYLASEEISPKKLTKVNISTKETPNYINQPFTVEKESLELVKKLFQRNIKHFSDEKQKQKLEKKIIQLEEII